MTSARQQNRDLIVVAVLGAILAAGAIAVPVTAVKAVLAAPLCLLLPGYVLGEIIFTRVSLERPLQVMLVPALSLVTLVLGGMLLNEVPGGLNESSWAVLLMVIIIGGSGVAWYLRGSQAPTHPRIQRAPLRLPSVKPGNVIVLLLAALIAAGALAASRIHLGAPNANGYESLTLTQLRHGQQSKRGQTVTLRLTSVRQHTASYKLLVTVGSSTRVRRTLRLSSGGSYTVTLGLGPSKVARTVTASAVLTPGNWTPRQVNVQLPPS